MAVLFVKGLIIGKGGKYMAAAYQEQAFRAFGISWVTFIVVLLKIMFTWVKIKI